MSQKYNNPFFKDNKEYKRDFFPLKHYVHQSAYYLHVMTGQRLEFCTEWLSKKLKNKSFADIKDPVVEYLFRDGGFDRELVTQPLSLMLRDIIKNKEIMAPSLTTYKNEEKEVSLVSSSIEVNITKRNVAKKKMFAAEAEEVIQRKKNNEEEANLQKSLWFFSEKNQTAFKLSNNAVSGMHNSAANPLFNPTSHSTLTSNCRITSGYGNANNEKILSGNRHYASALITIANIISIISNTDYDKLGVFIKKNNFNIPSVDETMQVIEYSSNYYWRNSVERKKIFDLVEKLNPLQRAAFVYTGDLYHIRKFNDSYMREFFTKLSSKVVDNSHVTRKDIKELNGDHVVWAHHVCSDSMKGRGSNYDEIEGTEVLATLYKTAENISKTLHDYSEFIEVFLMTNNVPASVARFPDSIRRSAIIGDTDSTIFTVQEWQVWYHGELAFDESAVAISSTAIALASQSIIHVLANMSANAGISKKNLRKTAMKNEYYFPVAVPTRVAKHYYAVTAIQEGNVKDVYDYQIKGVHLISSNAPPFVTNEAKRMMKEIIKTVMERKPISMKKILNDVTVMENKVLESLLKGEGTFYRSGQIKTLDSYKAKDTPAKTNYFQYMLWDEVFAPKYGNIVPPPYAVYKLSTEIGSPTLTNKWLENMPDQEFAKRMKNFMQKHKRAEFNTFWIPKEYVAQNGLPVELQTAIGARHMVADVCKVFYIILETLGWYGLNSKETNLVMDYYLPNVPDVVLSDDLADKLEDVILELDDDNIDEEESEIEF